MKRIFIALIAFILLASAFVGCGDTQNEESNAGSQAESLYESSAAENESAVSDGNDSSLPPEDISDIEASTPEAVEKDEYYEGYLGSEKTLLLKLGYGSGRDEIAFDPAFKSKEALSAESFIVQDGEIHLLDSFADKIKRFTVSGEFISQVGFSEFAEYGTPVLMAYNQKDYAVLYYQNYSVIEPGETEPQKPDLYIAYLRENGENTIYCLNDLILEYGAHYCFDRMEFIGKELHLYSFESNYKIELPEPDGEISVEPYASEVGLEYGNDYITFVTEQGSNKLQKDEITKKASSNDAYFINGCVYRTELYWLISSDYSFYEGEARFLRYTKDGKLLDYAIIGDRDDGETLPFKEFFVDSDGKVYFMSCRKDGVYIFEVEMGNNAISPAFWIFENELD